MTIRKVHSRPIRVDFIKDHPFYTTLRVMSHKQWTHYWLTADEERDLLAELLGKVEA